ncbi:hypothetical protein [Microbacterium sp. G2-8]|nr:hypothetical protein [Microbacterium sp. G2-8]
MPRILRAVCTIIVVTLHVTLADIVVSGEHASFVSAPSSCTTRDA